MNPRQMPYHKRLGYRFACWLERWARGLRSDLDSEMQIRDQLRYEFTRLSVLLKERCTRPESRPHLFNRQPATHKE